MGKVIGFVSIKGGVGKTTVTSSLASTLVNNFNKKVLLVDANYSAPNLGLHMDIIEPKKSIHEVLAGKARITSAIHGRYGVDVVPGRYFYNKKLNPLKLKDRLALVKKNYDFIILDSSPSLNEEILSSVIASDNLFIISTPDYPTLSCTLMTSGLAKHRGKQVSGIILNKVNNPAFEISLKDIEEVTGIPVVARIPEDASNAKALFKRVPSALYSPKSGFSKEINKLAAALSDVAEKKSIWRKLFPVDYRKEEVNREILRKSFN